jgi:hypothetical protein
MPSPRRFPPPWTIEELNDACFVVSDANGQEGRSVEWKLVTSYLVVHKGQTPCKRYCKLGHQTLYSRHQQRRRGPCYKSPNEGGRHDHGA